MSASVAVPSIAPLRSVRSAWTLEALRDRVRLAPWIASSVAIHLLILAALVVPAGHGDEEVRSPGAVLTATLASSAQQVAVPLPSPLPSSEAPKSSPGAEETALLPLPPKPSPRPRAKPTPGGQVTINLIDGELPDPAFEAVLRQFYPGALRAAAEFDVLPAASYPKAALAEQRNVHLRVLVILHEDGRVELAKGSLHDPLFTPSIREALASARMPPASDQGRPPLAWALLLFVYEYVGTS